MVNVFSDIKYEKQFSKKFLSGKEYLIVDSVPKLNSQGYQQISDEVKDKLFQIFKKYI